MKTATLIAVLLMIVSAPARARPIPEAQAVKAILGEASGEGYLGMMAVAAALRNRGTLHGVYGVNARRPQTPRTRRMALAAWRDSIHNDPTHGATHWASKDDLETGIFDFMTVTAVIGNHTFFKPKL